MTTKSSIEGQRRSEQSIQRERNMIGDLKFKTAMMLARRHCRERFIVGVDARPGTNHPRFTPHRGLPVIRAQSPGALCAESASSGRSATDSF